MDTKTTNSHRDSLEKINCWKCGRGFYIKSENLYTQDAVVKCIYCSENIIMKQRDKSKKPEKDLNKIIKDFEAALKRANQK